MLRWDNFQLRGQIIELKGKVKRLEGSIVTVKRDRLSGEEEAMRLLKKWYRLNTYGHDPDIKLVEETRNLISDYDANGH